MTLRQIGRHLRGALLIRSAYADEGGNGDLSTSLAGNGDGNKQTTFTQDELDTIIGQRLARAEQTFKASHDLVGLTAKAEELDALKGETARKEQERADAALLKGGDADKIAAEYETRLAAKDQAMAVKTQQVTGKLRAAFASIAMARVADQLHEEAKPTFSGMLSDRLGVNFDDEAGEVKVFVVGESGQPALNASGDPLTIYATVDAILSANAFLRKPSPGGSGAPTTPGAQPGSPVTDAAKTAEQNPNHDHLAALLGKIVDTSPEST